MEAEDLGKRSEKGNKHHCVSPHPLGRIEGRSLPRLVTKVSVQEGFSWRQGRENLVLDSGLSSHKVAGP